MLNLALSYGSRAEIVSAVQELCQEVADRKLAPEDITESLFSSRLETGNMPDPELIIRTSGEMRLSNFLMWQAAYAELIVLDILLGLTVDHLSCIEELTDDKDDFETGQQLSTKHRRVII